MMTSSVSRTPACPSRTGGPGRPKDLEKRAAVLEAAKVLFLRNGFEGASMDAIAAAAGVSKLTVYSHFSDKETLFGEAIRDKCAQLVPESLFAESAGGRLREQLESIGRAYFALVTDRDAIALHRLVASDGRAGSNLSRLYWDAGPHRMHSAFKGFLERAVESRQLDIDDVPRAASQFLCLLRGELHARRLCGCTEPIAPEAIDSHIHATVDMFLRAYAAPGSGAH